MAITESWGYAGEINAPEWAQLMPYAAGMQYGVKTYASWRPSIGGAGDRALTIAAGDGWGHGVMDRNDAPVTLNLPASSSGSRWDLIVARRIWATGTTTFARVAGSATKALPARLNTPGVEDEQPIALARVQAGSAAVVELIDLRCVPGDSGLLAFDELALSYLSRVGTQVRIGGRTWVRDVDGTGNPRWTGDVIVPFQRLGAEVAGIALPASGTSGGMIVKTGQITDSGFAQFGNQYLAGVSFGTPFPNGILSVQITQIQVDGAIAAPIIAVDAVNASGFRAFCPGQPAGIKRSFMWTAIGF